MFKQSPIRRLDGFLSDGGGKVKDDFTIARKKTPRGDEKQFFQAFETSEHERNSNINRNSYTSNSATGFNPKTLSPADRMALLSLPVEVQFEPLKYFTPEKYYPWSFLYFAYKEDGGICSLQYQLQRTPKMLALIVSMFDPAMTIKEANSLSSEDFHALICSNVPHPDEDIPVQIIMQGLPKMGNFTGATTVFKYVTEFETYMEHHPSIVRRSSTKDIVKIFIANISSNFLRMRTTGLDKSPLTLASAITRLKLAGRDKLLAMQNAKLDAEEVKAPAIAHGRMTAASAATSKDKSDLSAMIRRAVSEANAPLYERIRALEVKRALKLLEISSSICSDTLLANVASNSDLLVNSSSTPHDIIVNFDSGANHIFVNNLSALDYPPVLGKINASVEVANGQGEKVAGTSTLLGIDCVYTPTFSETLLGVSSFTAPQLNELPKVAIFEHGSVMGISITPVIRALLDDINTFAVNNKLVRLFAPQLNGLYKTTVDSLQQLKDSSTISETPNTNGLFKNTLLTLQRLRSKGSNSFTSTADERLLQSILMAKKLTANSSYYNYRTAGLDSLEELVLFFHQTWQHANEQQMVDIVKHKLIKNTPKQLTVAAIRKYFPTCDSCIKGNMAAAPNPSNPISREVKIGQEIEVDIKFWTNPDGSKAKSCSGCNMSVTAMDLKSKKLFGHTTASKANLVRYIKQIHAEVLRKQRVWELLRIDNEFLTAEIREYCQAQTPVLKIAACIPYEHLETVGIERRHRTIQDSVVKSLNKPHLKSEYWAMSYHNTIDVLNLMPHPDDPSTSAELLWEGHVPDLKETPMLPFGAVVRAHIPLALQTTLGGRSFTTLYSGMAKGHRGGLTLFNPLTKRTIVRRTFKVMGDSPCDNTLLEFEYDTLDEIVDDHPSIYAANIGAPDVVQPVANLLTPATLDALGNVCQPAANLLTPTSLVISAIVSPSIMNALNPGMYVADVKDANADNDSTHDQVIVQSIISHTGPPAKPSKMFFLVHWKGRDSTLDSWLPWKEVKDLAALDTYININPDLSILNPSPTKPATHVMQTRSRNTRGFNGIQKASSAAVSTTSYRRKKTTPACTSSASFAIVMPENIVDDKNRIATKHKLSTTQRARLGAIRQGRGRSAGTRGMPFSYALKHLNIVELRCLALDCIQAVDMKIATTVNVAKFGVKQLKSLIVSSKFLCKKKYITLVEFRTMKESLANRRNFYENSNLGSLIANMVTVPSSGNAIPQSVEQARASPESIGYMGATTEEISSIKSMAVFHTPTLSIKDIPRHLILPSKMVYDKVFNADGSFKKYKARLCARGDRWQDIYGTETYAGTVKSESVRFLLAIAAELDYEIECVDVKTAFLHSELEPGEIIYLRRPKGLTDEDMPEIVQLDKCIYGLPQASARFREHSDSTLRKLGFVPLISDPCVYCLTNNGTIVYAAVHVDDIGLIGSNKLVIAAVKKGLSETYKLTEQLDMTYYLGLHIIRDRQAKKITLLQDGYIDSLKEKYADDIGTSESFPSTPMLAMPLTIAEDPDVACLLNTSGITDYQGIIGSLLYLASQTRPDILFSVCSLARKSKAPSMADRKAAVRVLRYISGTSRFGLVLHSGEGIRLYATVDASYACHLDLKSHTGCTLHIGRNSGSVNSLSKKQTITADSSTVAELIGAHLAAHEIMWARNFLAELGFPQEGPTILFEDNLSTISLIVNKGNGQRTKHIDLRYNFVREQVVDNIIKMTHLSGVDMTSDILTKALGPTAFLHLRPSLLGMSAILLHNLEVDLKGIILKSNV